MFNLIRRYFSKGVESFDFVICGLGNPEPKYKNQRHNIGKIFINDFAKEKKLNFTSHK